MRLLVVILLIAALSKSSFAFEDPHEPPILQKYNLNREPAIDKFAKFSNVVVETKWMEQKLDHFNPHDNRTWNMRYMENKAYLVGGGTIFIYIGGEWEIKEGWLRTGHMHDMARDLRGVMFYTEHRYYGQSRPTADLSTENLRFLNVGQALADLANFIVTIKSEPVFKNSGVILVGGSYAATMATWFMQKYPHLANGAWASSAPLKAKIDFVEYKEVVSQAMESRGGQACANRIRNAFSALDRLAAQGNSAEIEKVFRLCYPLNLSNSLDSASFFQQAAGPFSSLVQYHKEQNQNIQSECNSLMGVNATSDLEALAIWWWDRRTGGSCFDHRFYNWVYWYTQTQWTDYAATSSVRQWLYQTCAEFGWYQTSGSDNILFGSGFPVEKSLALCSQLYDGIFTPANIQGGIDYVNSLYGALKPWGAKNVYSTHGEFDPWRPMGVQEDINESSPTTILPLETHCADLNSISSRDSPEMLASKEKIFYLILDWLQPWICC